jgi:putative ATPase
MVAHGALHEELLTFSPASGPRDRWLMRTIDDAGRRLAEQRDRLFGAVTIKRHDRVLVVNAGSGLLVWEALRQAPEGGVWAWAHDEQEAAALRQTGERLSEVERPIVLHGPVHALAELMTRAEQGDVRFDVVLGHSTLTRAADKVRTLAGYTVSMSPHGVLGLLEAVPCRGQRVWDLIDEALCPAALRADWMAAEEGIYASADDPMVNWDAEELRAIAAEAGLTVESLDVREATTQRLVSRATVDGWFSESRGDRPTYAEHLTHRLGSAKVATVRSLLERYLAGQTVAWRSSAVLLVARPKA